MLMPSAWGLRRIAFVTCAFTIAAAYSDKFFAMCARDLIHTDGIPVAYNMFVSLRTLCAMRVCVSVCVCNGIHVAKRILYELRNKLLLLLQKFVEMCTAQKAYANGSGYAYITVLSYVFCAVHSFESSAFDIRIIASHHSVQQSQIHGTDWVRTKDVEEIE